MRRIQYHEYGGPEVLKLEEFELPSPGDEQLLVRVRAAAANPVDWEIRSGQLKMMTGRRFPRGLGQDFAGVVETVGAGVTRLRAGDEVFGGATLKDGGAFGEMVIADEKAVVKKPSNLSFAEAAALPTVALTAYQALARAKLEPGQSLFVTGALGNVGRSVIQLARARGVSVGGSCRDSAIPQARELGFDPAVGFDFEASRLAGRFDLVLDTSGSLSAAKTLLKKGGRIIDIKPTPAKFVKSVLPGPFSVLIARVVTEDMEALAQAARDDVLRLPVASSVSLNDAIPAFVRLEQDHTPKGGKLVIAPT